VIKVICALIIFGLLHELFLVLALEKRGSLLWEAKRSLLLPFKSSKSIIPLRPFRLQGKPDMAQKVGLRMVLVHCHRFYRSLKCSPNPVGLTVIFHKQVSQEMSNPPAGLGLSK
jgi:hypothetical protein